MKTETFKSNIIITSICLVASICFLSSDLRAQKILPVEPRSEEFAKPGKGVSWHSPDQEDTGHTSPQGKNQKVVSIHVKDSTVEYVINEVARQANLKVIYGKSGTDLGKRVSISIKNTSVQTAISRVLESTGITASFTSDGETIIIRGPGDSTGIPDNEKKQKGNGIVRGIISDSATGKGIAGVTVTLQPSGVSVVTNDRGAYVISNAPYGSAVVSLRIMGYRTVTRSIQVAENSPAVINMVLAPAATMLNEVVTSVTGSQRKLEIGNDVTTINVDSVIRTAPVSNVTDLLETRVPGLTVIRSSGVPGSPSRLRLRGLGGGMLSDREGAPTNDPIVIVDGIRINASQSSVTDQNLAMAPGSIPAARTYSTEFPPPSAIDQIDPNSIEKIEVFKGPSAAALYGSDAANGVIVITTKQGQIGPTRWSLTANQELEYLPGTYVAPGYYPFCHRVTSIGSGNGGPTMCTYQYLNASVIDSVVRFQALDVPRLTPFGTGHGNGLTATVSGGSQAYTYSITGSVGSSLGLLKLPDLYQDMFRSVYDSAVPNWMKRPNLMRTRNINATFVTQPMPGLRTTFITRLSHSTQRQSSAQLRLADLASSYIDTLGVAPYEIVEYATRVTAARLTADYSLAAHWDRWSFLPLTATFGLNRMNRDESRFEPQGLISASSRGTTKGFYSSGIGSSSMQTARINGTIMPILRVSTAIGAEVTRNSTRQYQSRMDSLGAGIVIPTLLNYASQRSYQTATGGWFIEPRLNLNSRFFVNPGFRFDGNNVSGSRSGRGNGIWSLFPRLNFSWVAIDQDDAPVLGGFITMLRPRLSFGIAGVQPAAGWQLRLMAPPGTNTSVDDVGLELSTLGNTAIHPERTREFEGGFDLEMWDGRISFSFTQFNKLRTDAIEQIAVAPSVYGGVLSQYRNIGRIRNAGTEITLNSILVENRLMRWSVNMSVSRYSNKLLSLSTEEPYIDVGNGTRFVPGYPVFGRWARPILGYSITEGRLSEEDILLGDSAVYVGQQAPNFDLPFSTAFSLFQGQLSLNATFHYKDGMTQFNRGNAQHLNNVYFNPTSTIGEQAAALAARCFFMVGAGAAAPNCTEYGLIQTVNSLRFTSMSIGYTVPRHISSRFNLPGIQLSVQGSNLGLWSNYRGKDPDVNSVTVGDVTLDDGQLPQPRMWRFQVRVSN